MKLSSFTNSLPVSRKEITPNSLSLRSDNVTCRVSSEGDCSPLPVQTSPENSLSDELGNKIKPEPNMSELPWKILPNLPIAREMPLLRCLHPNDNTYIPFTDLPEPPRLPQTEPICDTVVNSVVKKFIQRSNLGKQKYGTTLDRTDLSTDEWANHMQEELMDAILYLERLRRELPKNNK